MGPVQGNTMQRYGGTQAFANGMPSQAMRPMPNNLFSTQQTTFGEEQAPGQTQQRHLPGISVSQHDNSFVSGSVHSDAKTSFYSNMQQSAQRKMQ